MTSEFRTLAADLDVAEAGTIRMVFAGADAVTSDGYHFTPRTLQSPGGKPVYIRLEHDAPSAETPFGVGYGQLRYDESAAAAVLEGKLFDGQDALRARLLELAPHGLPESSMGVSWYKANERRGAALTAHERGIGAKVAVDRGEVREVSLVHYGELSGTSVQVNARRGGEPPIDGAELAAMVKRQQQQIDALALSIDALRRR